jgi:hypothetical protein
MKRQRLFVVLLAVAVVLAAQLPVAGGGHMGVFSLGWSLRLPDGSWLAFTGKDGLFVDSVLGAGMPPVENITDPYAIIDGSIYQRTAVRQRVITLVIRAQGRGCLLLHSVRRRLIEAVSPHRLDTPLVLRYHNGVDTLDIECYYDGGLELGGTDSWTETIALRLLAVDPFWRRPVALTAVLDVYQSIANTNRIEQRDTDGNWSNLLNGADDVIRCFAYDPQGRLYVGGQFTAVGGVAAANIARWNGTAWSALGVGTDSVVYTLRCGPDGNIYVGGAFHNAGGGAAWHVARYNVGASTWSALGAGVGAGDVADIIFDNAGLMYACGSFITAGGVNALRIASWDGAAWAAVGAGFNGIANEMVLGMDGCVYVTGWFSNIDGGIVVNGITKWNGTAWSALGTGLADSVFTVRGSALCALPDGRIVVGGLFDSAGGVAANRIAVWNGAAWSALGSGVDAEVYALSLDLLGQLRATGVFTTSGDGAYVFPMAHAIWRSPMWVAAESASFGGGGSSLYELAYSTDGLTVSGGSFSGALSHPGITAVTNIGTANAWPIITFTGPGRLYHLINYTTGKRIDFNVTLMDGETLTLDLRPGHKTFVSSYRGNLINLVLPGDLTTWALAPGANSIAAWVDDASAAGSLGYYPSYWSFDGLVQ